MKLIILLILLFPLLSHASNLKSVYLIESCQNKDCLKLKMKFEDQVISLQANEVDEMTIKQVAVKREHRNDTPYLEIILKPRSSNSSIKQRHLVFRHQVLTYNLKRDNDNIKGIIKFPKNTSLQSANKYCLVLDKNCHWMSTNQYN